MSLSEITREERVERLRELVSRIRCSSTDQHILLLVDAVDLIVGDLDSQSCDDRTGFRGAVRALARWRSQQQE